MTSMPTELALWEALTQRGDSTCLAVSHRRAALARADRIIVLADGAVVGTGTLEALRGRNAHFDAVWEGAR